MITLTWCYDSMGSKLNHNTKSMLSYMLSCKTKIMGLDFHGPINLFPKRHILVHNGGSSKFGALYCSLNMVCLTEIL